MSNRAVTPKETFEKKIKPLLTYIGTIGATLMIFAYIAIVIIMVFGFQARNFSQTVIFAIVNAVIGFIILQFLKIQGIDLARGIEENQKVLDEYNATKTRDKKFRSIKYYWVTSVLKDILIKVTTILVTTMGLIYIIIEGTEDYMLFLMAFVNIILFVCLGLLSLASAYDFFNEKHIPYIKHELEEFKNEDKRSNEKSVAVVKEEHNQQRNDSVCGSSRVDILESSVDNCDISDLFESLVVDSNSGNDNILGGSIHTSDSSTNSTDCRIEENS